MLGETLGRFGWKDIFSMSPLYFLGLCISPNFDQNRLIVVLVAFLLFFIPAWNFISSLNSSSNFYEKLPGIVWAVVGMVIGSLASYWFVATMGVVLCAVCIIIHVRGLRQTWQSRFGLGFAAVFILYLGLNDYEPGQLIQAKVILMAMVAGLWCAYSFLYRPDVIQQGTNHTLRWLSLIWIPGLYFSIQIIFDQHAAGKFLLPAAVLFVFSVARATASGKRSPAVEIILDSVLPILSELTFMVFLIYFFLNNSHVLQVFG